MVRLLQMLLVMPVLASIGLAGEESIVVPQDVTELWGNYDARAEPLDARISREWAQDGDTYRLVSYNVGAFKGTKARMAGYYGFPKSDEKVAGLLHIHGGGQKAFLNEVEYYVKRGYACISINWGGKDLGEKSIGQDATDWGAIDPTQKHPGQYMSFLPGAHTIEKFESARNCSWYPLIVACRRALTFLEQQAEVDSNRLGVYGHSMGGTLTFYVAGTDSRVKAAVPSVGGPGFLSFDVEGLPGTARHFAGSDVELYRRTMGHQSYAGYVKCPILFLGATNDFNSRMDHVHKTYGLIGHENKRFAFAPHLNHRFTAAVAVCRPLWLDSHLRKAFSLAKTPESNLILKNADRIPVLEVTPERANEVAGVDVYYSFDRDAIARFWRSARVVRKGDSWVGECPVMTTDEPLFAFANVSYKLAGRLGVLHHGSTDTYTISSLLHGASAKELRAAEIGPADEPSLLIEDFSKGFRDWFVLSGDNPHHWVYSTRKITDPKWRGPSGARLSLKLRSQEDNKLVLVLFENEWRGYRGRRKTYAAEVSLKGTADWQRIVLDMQDFKQVHKEGRADEMEKLGLSKWSEIDRLEIRAYYDIVPAGDAKKLGTAKWQGPRPHFGELRWLAE